MLATALQKFLRCNSLIIFQDMRVNYFRNEFMSALLSVLIFTDTVPKKTMSIINLILYLQFGVLHKIVSGSFVL
jgi:hypothetical protein